MKHTIFTGMATAMVTPMTGSGVDYEALERFIEFQILNGINALVAVGTTGESATLSPEERREVIRFTLEKANGRVPVIAGTGCNNTANAVNYSVDACREGADALLIVTPYYNKATQNGLMAHYTAIADAVDRPIILYNVPSRTGCNLLPETVEKLSQHENIAGIKEASGNMTQVVELISRCHDTMDVYSGEDAMTVPMMAMGAKGAISVLSDVAPAEAVAMSNAALAGDFQTAARLQCQYLPLIQALFSEVNPIPAKAAVSAMGYGEEDIRLPLTPMEPEHRRVLFSEMRKLGINV